MSKELFYLRALDLNSLTRPITRPNMKKVQSVDVMQFLEVERIEGNAKHKYLSYR